LFKKIDKGRILYFKKYFEKNILKNIFRKSKGTRNLIKTILLRKYNLPVIRNCISIERGFFHKTSLFIYEEIKGKKLLDFISNVQIEYLTKMKVLNELVELIFRLHRHNLLYGDFDPTNILIDSNQKLYFIDYDTIKYNMFLKKSKIKELFKFNRFIYKYIKLKDRLTLLKYYYSLNNWNWNKKELLVLKKYFGVRI
jgi:tRNA A-37 threonylcarbamoyl transferase component Bud32